MSLRTSLLEFSIVVPVSTQIAFLFFLAKYGETTLARNLIANEYRILTKLEELKMVPQIIRFVEDEAGTFLQTEYFYGQKPKYTSLTAEIYNFICAVSVIEVNRDVKSTYVQLFSHGDFCPWNMLISETEIKMIDWEMAGLYPAGYDLFTYIFQTNFLIHPHKPIQEILNKNKQYIKEYFDRFQIENWSEYLSEFCRFKIKICEKNGSILLNKYKELEIIANETI